MIVVDLNLLLYAVNETATYHRPAQKWWEKALISDKPIGLPWVVVLGFLRISTQSRIFPNPLATEDALNLVDSWLEFESVRPLAPGPEHWFILRDLLGTSGVAGNLTTDAHLAAIAIENGATLFSTDSDFGRFAQLRWENPLA